MDNETLTLTEATETTQAIEVGLLLDERYELTEFLARGGMGSVYKAIQWPLGREVAIKVLQLKHPRDKEAFQERFFLEASLCARLTHPNIVRVFDYGTNRGQHYYIVMELIDGQTLDEVLVESGAFEPHRAILLMKQICSALTEAHGQGLVHRDLKLRNLMVTSPTSGEDFVRVLDFGLATQMHETHNEMETIGLIGSPMYMSPEQIQRGEVDLRADLYALGVILYMLLTGQAPFRGKTPKELFLQHIDDPVPGLSQAHVGRRFSPALSQIVQKAMAKAPKDRYQSADELFLALDECGTALQAEPPSAAVHPFRTSDILDEPTMDHDTDEGFAPEVRSIEALGWAQDTQSTDGFRDRKDLLALQSHNLRDYTAYIDFNCPFCYALHERLVRWSVADRISWRLVIHASHVLTGPFTITQQTLLANEVFSLQRRAPDVRVLLPPKRCTSDEASLLAKNIEDSHPEQITELRTQIYRALWLDGKDIGDPEVLGAILDAMGLPRSALVPKDASSETLDRWQDHWEKAPYDCSIPVLTNEANEGVLIGLPSERTLMEFLLQERTRVVDSAVCYYQQRPVVLVMGDVEHLWLLLSEVRHHCDILHAPNAAATEVLLNGSHKPDLLMVDNSICPSSDVQRLSELAKDRSLPWVLATHSTHVETEEWALSLGAAEFLTIAGDCELARARLQRILLDRFSMAQLRQESRLDVLTGLISRRTFLDQLEKSWEQATSSNDALSLLLIDLDHFQAYNKLHGHLAGDRCLRAIAAALSEGLGDTDLWFGRFGGNEFVILPRLAGTEEAETIAHRVLSILSDAALPHGVSPISPHVTVSVGVGRVDDPANAPFHDLLESADKARLAAKKAGGNQIHTIAAS